MSAENMVDKEVREYDGYNYKFISSGECNACDSCSFIQIFEERENKALEVLGDCSGEGREDKINGYFILTSEKVTKEVKQIKKEPEKTIISHKEEFVVKTKRTTAAGKDLTTSQFTRSGTLEDAKILLADLQKRQGNEKYCIKGIKCDPPKIIKLTTIVTEEDVFDVEEGTVPSEDFIIGK